MEVKGWVLIARPLFKIMAQTKRGIFYDLSESTYSLCLDNITYVFSSISYMAKFQNQYIFNREDFAKKLYARYGLKIHFNVLADILLYRKIEKRGCYILDCRGDEICLETQNLIGMLLIQKILKKQ
jgi:hypothetical protein